MQTVFRNPLAGPSVLGISSGASLGVAFVVLLSGAFGGVALSKLGYIHNKCHHRQGTDNGRQRKIHLAHISQFAK